MNIMLYLFLIFIDCTKGTDCLILIILNIFANIHALKLFHLKFINLNIIST